MTEEQIKSLIDVKWREINELQKDLKALILKKASYSIFDVFMNTHGSLYTITGLTANIDLNIVQYKVCGITKAIDGERHIYVENNFTILSENDLNTNFTKLGTVKVSESRKVLEMNLGYNVSEKG